MMDKVQALQARIAADPYDAQAWEQLVGERMEARRRNPEALTELRATFDDLLKVFPTAVSLLAALPRGWEVHRGGRHGTARSGSTSCGADGPNWRAALHGGVCSQKPPTNLISPFAGGLLAGLL